MLRDRLAGVPGLEIAVRPVSPDASPPGASVVDVDWQGGVGVMFEVVDWVGGVRVIDPQGEDVSVDVALRYAEARAAGVSRKYAWSFARGDQ